VFYMPVNFPVTTPNPNVQTLDDAQDGVDNVDGGAEGQAGGAEEPQGGAFNPYQDSFSPYGGGMGQGYGSYGQMWQGGMGMQNPNSPIMPDGQPFIPNFDGVSRAHAQLQLQYLANLAKQSPQSPMLQTVVQSGGNQLTGLNLLQIWGMAPPAAAPITNPSMSSADFANLNSRLSSFTNDQSMSQTDFMKTSDFKSLPPAFQAYLQQNPMKNTDGSAMTLSQLIEALPTPASPDLTKLTDADYQSIGTTLKGLTQDQNMSLSDFLNSADSNVLTPNYRDYLQFMLKNVPNDDQGNPLSVSDAIAQLPPPASAPASGSGNAP
jgi:hypothetical protein